MRTDINCDEFVERLADLLEREVDETTRAALESHAVSCGECGGMLADMRKLRIDAASLPVLAPSRNLWEGISQRIDAPVIPLRAGADRSVGRGAPWQRWGAVAAAACLLVALTATSTYYLTIHSRGVPGQTANVPPAAKIDSVRSSLDSGRAASAVASNVRDSATGASRVSASMQPRPATVAVPPAQLVSNKRSAQQVYASEIARLHAIVERRRAQLDPVTISVIERNLRVIDDAIAQCRLALVKDPASRFLMESLNNALENKVELLRTATMLPARS